ncbi:beta-galactosidase trimerization domain-containing protein [Asticcacaulis sp. SL142]|uniref:beta-galactosidase n=1 Tax=Asticcacaulis sp. SL142 TaxID=2995155 RepID=UPI00226D27E1|nr:beta-galactosidase trimerization domain-containing protein [Asticcacaulis sp. SL142]WAC49449.1 beta-galactosidase trimerization domain-containing protein [Asticcacaulis sp. SL142]
MEKMGFPRDLKPEVAIAYSFEARVASNPKSWSNTVKQYMTTPYLTQAHNAFSPLYADNIDMAVLNIAEEDLSRYKLVVVPGIYLMDKASADNLRKYVNGGGTVVMTAMSAKVNDNNQWFNTPLPGQLSDVFGLKTREFYRTEKPLTGKIGDAGFTTTINFYEVLEPSTAKVMGSFDNVDGAPPVITVNQYGKGRAIYVATPAQPSVMAPLYKQLYTDLGLKVGPKTPEGVYARTVNGQTLYVNTTTETKTVAIDGKKTGVLSGTAWSDTLTLPSYGVEFLK